MAFLIGATVLPANILISSSTPATDNAIARYDGISGLLLEDSLVTISDSDAVIIPGGGSLTVAALSGVIKASAGLLSGGADSDDVPEGATNLYYTEARVSANTDVAANTADRHTAITPGGVDTQVQFNDSGAFGGDAGLTYNKTTDKLTVAGDLEVSTTAKQILASDAGTSTPAYSYAADPNTGLANSAANQLTLSTDGASRIDISNTRDTHRVLLRFAPDGTHIIGEASNNRPSDINMTGRLRINSGPQLEKVGSDAVLSSALGVGSVLTIGTNSSLVGPEDFSFNSSIPGILEQKLQNTNSGASTAEFRIITSGSLDSILSFGVAATEWGIGIDNDDNDAYVMGVGRVLGTTRALRIDASTRDVLIDNDLEIDGDLNHDGTNVGFHGVTPAPLSAAYAITNVTPDRAYDANSTTLDEVADTLGTLIADLKLKGVIG